jgi:hypothetical protein
MTVLKLLNNPDSLKFQFKLNQYKFKYAEERKAIRLKLTLAIIEDILNDKSQKAASRLLF